MLPLGIILMGFGYAKSIFTWQLFSNSVVKVSLNGEPFRVITYNVHSFRSPDSKQEQTPLPNFEAFLDDYHPDILFLQEAGSKVKYRQEVVKALRERGLEFNFWEADQRLAIFSRYPLEPKTANYFNGTNGFLIAEATIQGKPVQLVNFHLQSNAITGSAEQLWEHPDVQDKETWRTLRSVLARYKRTTITRADQARQILARIQQEKPLILGGDLNDLPTSFVYRKFGQPYSDTFLAAGKGWGQTYRGEIPGLHIDYLFVNRAFVPLGTRVGRIDLSDHQPVISDLGFRID